MNTKTLLLLATTVPFFLAAAGGSGDEHRQAATQPGAAVAQPGAAVVQPGAAVDQPGAAVTQPGAAVVQPGAAAAPATTGERDAAPQGQDKKAPKFDKNLLKAFFGGEPPAPASDNTVTDDKVALGRLLYHEKSLSKNGNTSCATCHDLTNYGVDGKPTSTGSTGTAGKRNTPTTLNAFRQFVQFWDGRAATVEEQATGPVLNPIEHGIADEAELVTKLKAKPELVAAFAKAFPGDGESVTVANFKLAIGAFERKLVTKSPFDEFLDGKNNALTTQQKIGLKTFIDVGCTACHTTRLLGGQMYQKVGVTAPYAGEDEGRFEVTKNEADKKMFKVSQLLNIAKTGPYLHDGTVKTLPEAVRLMAKIQLNKDLKDEEVEAIVAFLDSLTGEVPEGMAMK